MRRLVTALLTGSLLVAASATAVLAKTEKIPVYSFTPNSNITIENPGTMTQVGSVVSLRGYVETGIQPTDNSRTTGAYRNVANWDLDLATGSGELWGTGTHWPTAYPGGTWTCVFHGTFVNYAWTGKGVCHATGTLRGWQWRVDLLPAADGLAAPGYIFLPGN